MPRLRELLTPLALLVDANARDRSLILGLELAALDGQPVVLPPRAGRVSARVRAAAVQAQERARCYQQQQAVRQVSPDPQEVVTELMWPAWNELPEPGSIFEHAGQHYLCVDVLETPPADTPEDLCVILALAVSDEEPSLG